MADKRYLLQRKQGWYLRVKVPEDLQNEIGRKEIVKSLKTRDLKEAQSKRWEAFATYQFYFSELRSQGKSEALRSTPNGILKYYQSQRKLIDIEPNESARIRLLENLSEQLYYEMEQFQEHGRIRIPRDEDGYRTDKPKHSSAFRAASEAIDPSRPPQNLISDLLDIHLKEIKARVNNQTANARERIVRSFIQWAGDCDVTEVSKKKAGDYVTKKIAPMDRSVKTKKDFVSDLSTFFNWCHERGQIELNPFSGLSKTIKGSSKGTSKKRRAFSKDELVKLLTAINTKRSKSDPLWPMVVIGLFTGMRSGEICEIELKDVHNEYIHVPESKSEAGVRDIPIHPTLKPLIKKLKEKPRDEYLIPNLKRGGADSKRNHAIGKRFTTILRSKNGAGIEDKTVVFHSLRKNTSTALENAGVPESTAQQIIGHEKNSMTYGLYSGGVGLDVLIEEISKINFGPEIEHLATS